MSGLDVELLITALNTVSDGLMIVDTSYNILYKNVAADEFLAGINDQFDFEKWASEFSILDVKSRRPLKKKEMPIFRAVNGHRFTDYRVLVINSKYPQGVYLSCNGTPLIGNNLNITGGVLTFRDVSASYLGERILSQERAFYKNILDLIPGSVFVKDGAGNYYFTNHEFEIIRKGVKEQLDDIDRHYQEIEKNDNEVIKSLIAKEFEEILTLKSGEQRFFRTIRFPIYNQTLDKVLVCGIAFDITERKKVEDNLAAERLRSINASKLAAIGALAGEIGHEINNPIAIIKSITFLLREMIEDHSLTETFLGEKIRTIEETLDRISKIICSLKNMSRKGLNENREPCTLKTVLNDVIPLAELKFKKNGVKFLFESDSPVMENMINCNHVQLGEVFINILANASDAVAEVKDPCVKMSVIEEKEFIALRIKDNGPGVDPAIREKIFEPFFTTKEIGKGTGLGLSISKNILKSHGGDISLEKVDKGTSFLIRFPKYSPH